MPEADGLEYPGRKDLIDWLEGYTAFSARIEPEIDIDQRGTEYSPAMGRSPEYGKNDFEGIEKPAG